MKRSIIIISVLILFIVIGMICEIVYSKTLTDKLKQSIEICKSTEDFKTLSRVSTELEGYLSDGERISRIFFTRRFIEKLRVEAANLVVYSKAGDIASFGASLKRLEIYVDDAIY